MRLLAIICSFVLFAACSRPVTIDSGANSSEKKLALSSGEEIVAEHTRRNAAPFRKDHVRFTIRPEGEPVEINEIDVWQRQTANGTDTMSIVTKPVEDAGSGSLTIETPGKYSVIVIYSAARDEFRETDTGKMFFGGLTAQELLGEWSKYTYKYLGDRNSDGAHMFEVEGKLKETEWSSIASTRILFDAETYLPVEMHLFGADGKELRTYRTKEVKTVDGHTYPARTEVENFVYHSHITIEVLSREYPASIDDSMFAREKLKQSVRK